ncbi:MAG: tripartite tricarboxylate transporter substrate binding protein [Zoogloeaceae bacterium]|nr:tripartite tricarboxylate transporter substrate binding protein [Zoogloeaceae bacterium]
MKKQQEHRFIRRVISTLGGIIALSSMGLSGGVPLAQAEEAAWPTRQITLVVPWSPGGSSDAFARIVSQELASALGQPVIVENRPGAIGTIGVRHVARSKPDGYTFLFGNTVSMIGSVVSSATPVQFDPLQDFVPVALVVETYYVLTAHPSVGVKNFREFLAWAQDPAKPPLAVGSTGNGATSDILYDYLIHKQKANLTKIAFKGTGPLVADLIAGHLPIGSAALSLVASHYKEGKLFPLVIVGKNRLPQLPDVPSVREFGLTAPDLSVWDGVFAPTGTPPAIIAALAAALKKANQIAIFKDLAEKNGSVVVFTSGADAAARLKKDLEERQRFKMELEQAQQ